MNYKTNNVIILITIINTRIITFIMIVIRIYK